jgi:cellulase/cellobiase CelA1
MANSWPGGFQGQVTVTAGSAAITGWTVKWTLGSGQTITQAWNGTLAVSGSDVTVTNASYNGSLPAGGTATFGFLANGTPTTPTLTCTA